MEERRHDPVRIEGEVVGLQLVAREQVEPMLGEGEAFAVQDEADPLAAGRLRGVVELETGHGATSGMQPGGLL